MPAPSARLPLAALLLALATVVAVAWIDEPLARAIDAHARGAGPAWLAATSAFDAVSGIDLWRWFVGALLVTAGLACAAVPRLAPHATTLWFVAVVHMAARLSTTPWKALFARLRPFQWLEAGQPAHSFFAGGIAFPSGHVIYYLSLGLPLALAYPRRRVVCLGVPALLGLTRIGASQHWLGDTLGAAAWVTFVTWVVAWLFEWRGRAAAAQRP